MLIDRLEKVLELDPAPLSRLARAIASEIR